MLPARHRTHALAALLGAACAATLTVGFAAPSTAASRTATRTFVVTSAGSQAPVAVATGQPPLPSPSSSESSSAEEYPMVPGVEFTGTGPPLDGHGTMVSPDQDRGGQGWLVFGAIAAAALGLAARRRRDPAATPEREGAQAAQ